MSPSAAPAMTTPDSSARAAVPLTLRGWEADSAFELRAELNRQFASRELPFLAQFRTVQGSDFSLEILDRSGGIARRLSAEEVLEAHVQFSLRDAVRAVIRRLELSAPDRLVRPAREAAALSATWCVST
ncbi:MAG TPA: hypothetical protein VGV89_09345 [Thermoplasmata archaeon]|nr:hypothetical protein [Thermoplasmata archaeon]